MSLQSITKELYSCFESKDYEKCQKLLVPVKLELIKHNLLIPKNPNSKDQINDLKITENILEIGALSSLLLNNYDIFDNYYSQLKPFYSSTTLHLKKEIDTTSTKIISLYLLYLLSRGLVSKFHVEIEHLSYFQHFDLDNDKYFQFPITFEKHLMEGNYIKIWNLLNEGNNLPCEEFKVFIDTLVNALRYEIAKSLEKTYNSIPISNCKNLLYYPQEENDMLFEESLREDLGMDWNFENGQIIFNNLDYSDDLKLDNSSIVKNVLNYADQIESII